MNNIKVLALMLILAGAADAFVCYDDGVTIEFANVAGEGIIVEMADINMNYPTNDTTIYASDEITWSFDTSVCSQTDRIGVRFNLTQNNNKWSNTDYWNIHNSTGTDNINTTRTITIESLDGGEGIFTGDYNYTFDIRYRVPGVPPVGGIYPVNHYSTPDYPYSLEATSNYNIGTNTGGACLTEYGYYITYNAGDTEDYVMFDLTSMSQYCRDTSCNNTFILGDGYYVYDDYQIVANTTFYKPVTLYIGGFNYNFNITRRDPTPDATLSDLTINNFTQQSKAYFLTYRNESTDEDLILDGMPDLDVKVFCESYSPDTLDVQTQGYNPLFLTTREQAEFEHIMDVYKSQTTTIENFENTGYDSFTDYEANTTNVTYNYVDQTVTINWTGEFNRVYDSYEDLENITVYIPENTSDYVSIDYQLNDYTGQFYDSYFKVIRNVNGSLVTLYQKKWYNTLLEDVDLVNETDYQYVLYTPTATRIIKWDYIELNGEKIITITTPTYTDKTSYRDNVLLGLTSSYTGSSVGLIYNVTDNEGVNVTLRVYNYTANGFQLMDSSTVEEPTTGSITVSVPDQNQTYWVTAECTHNTHGVITFGEYLKPSQSQSMFPMYGSWGLPDTILGVTKDSWYTGAALFLITGAAFTIPGGVGGVLVAGAIGVTKWMGWFREMTWGLWGFIAVMAIIYAFVENRRRET